MLYTRLFKRNNFCFLPEEVSILPTLIPCLKESFMKLVSDHCPSLFRNEAKLTVTSPLTPSHFQSVVELTTMRSFLIQRMLQDLFQASASQHWLHIRVTWELLKIPMPKTHPRTVSGN